VQGTVRAVFELFERESAYTVVRRFQELGLRFPRRSYGGAWVVGPAMAADMPVKAPVMKAPPIVPPYSWAGCYVGGTLGGVRGRSTFAWTGITESAIAFAAGAATVLPAAANATLSDTGITGGGEIGCNFQSGTFVYGIQGDWQYTGLSVTRPCNPFGQHQRRAGDDCSWRN
jgi:hypothetical protein